MVQWWVETGNDYCACIDCLPATNDTALPVAILQEEDTKNSQYYFIAQNRFIFNTPEISLVQYVVSKINLPTLC